MAANLQITMDNNSVIDITHHGEYNELQSDLLQGLKNKDPFYSFTGVSPSKHMTILNKSKISHILIKEIE